MAPADDDKKLSVPRFSSFKPKPSASSSAAESETPKAEKRGQEELRHGSSRHHHRSQHQRHDRHRRETSHRGEARRDSRDGEHSHRRRENREDTRPLPDRSTASSVPGLFVIDKKGDPLIRKYGLERSKVPKYHRVRGGSVLGTSGRLWFHHDGPREEFSLLFSGDRKPGSRDGGGLRSRGWQKRDAVKLRARRGRSPDDLGDGYLSLQHPKKRKRLAKNSDSSDAEDQPSWRSIEGKAKAVQVQDADDDSTDSDGSSSDPAPSDDGTSLRSKSIRLNRLVKDNPQDIEAWLELADHQDALLRDGETVDDMATESTAHSFAEIKVHLLESALSHASRPEDRQRVLVALMREGGKLWNRDAAAKKWFKLGNDELGNFELWKTHLDYSMSSIVTFRYEDVKAMMLKRLHQALSRSGLGSEDDLEEAIYIFLRATRLFHDAGYKELAVAAWQGLFELNLFRPDGAESQSETLSAFEAFWEEEGPRFGEAGARGWKHRVESSGFEEPPEAVAEARPAAQRACDPYRAWAAAERARGERASLPARTMDADTDDDPFRVVMFSDIEPWLFVIPRDRLPHATRQLVDAFLLFCGLPLALGSNDWLQTAYHDQFLTGTGTKMRPRPVWEVAETAETEQQRKPPLFVSGNCAARMSPELLFGGNGWFQYFDVAGKGDTAGLGWAELALKQLVYSGRVPDLALYYLGLCVATKPNAIRKQAKALLKRYPSDVRLYNAYALAEFANGNVDTSVTVLASALESAELSTASTGFLLCKTWSWIELERGDKEMATKRLCASIDGSLRRREMGDTAVSPATVLKARQAFASNAQQFLYEGSAETASSHAECLLLLAYLTGEGGNEPRSAGQGNVSAAMEAAESMSREPGWRESGNDGASELLFQWASRILYWHAAKGPFRRVYVREQLSRFIKRFPRNTTMLHLYDWADSTIRVVDETRQLLYDTVLVKKVDSVRSRMFAIQHELGSGNANSTRAAFEHAVGSEACRHSAVVWAWYVGFCQSQEQLVGQAKGVFYRALAHCPWSKEVMMGAFAGGLGSDELRSVYATMESKGLRLHAEVDE